MVRKGVGVCLGLVALSGCAMPSPKWQDRPSWARLGNTSKADDSAPASFRDPHHQYYDKQHRRYYYYDLDKKQFYWENGEPKT